MQVERTSAGDVGLVFGAHVGHGGESDAPEADDDGAAASAHESGDRRAAHVPLEQTFRVARKTT